ncbi:MAG TPA: alpha-glucan family phosphorylase, partial [Chitinophagaceae bacterium]
PLFLLSTDLPENDYLSQTITHRIYDADTAAKIAQYLLLGIGGAKLLDTIGYDADVYHLNEAHGLPAAFYLYHKYDSAEAVKKRLVFTTHTPEEAGNEKHDIRLLDEMGYFGDLSLDTVRKITGIKEDEFNHSLVALRFARLANGVSKLHGEVAREMWGKYEGICPIISITNAQNWSYWADKKLYKALDEGNDDWLDDRKKFLKRRAFDIVADQTGDWLEPDILTIVWARRFAGYKRPDLITQLKESFERLLSNTRYPVQIIWAGKPYPMDYTAISTFNSLVHLSKQYKNCSVMVGYELSLSKRLKQGADIWLNNPRVPREASGTSGMTAAMNGAVNFSTDDGWIPEFIKHGENGFLIPQADYRHLPVHEQDHADLLHLYRILETEILPLYYDDPNKWREIMKNGMRGVRETFDSNRMAREYYEQLYA